MCYRRLLLAAIIFTTASDVWCNNDANNLPVETIFPVETVSPVETLYYKLSYRGLLTSMIWADLADIKMTSIVGKHIPKKAFEYTNYHQYELYLSTEHYRKAEILHPVRYTYRTIVDSTLQRTLLVEEMDSGDNDSYDILWLDWKNNSTQLFEKSKSKNAKRLPEDLTNMLLSNTQKMPIAYKMPITYKKPGDKIAYAQILDPLSLLYFLRAIDFVSDSTLSATTGVKEIPIVVSDDIRLYRVEKLLDEVILLNGKAMQTIKLKMVTKEKKDNNFYVWLSNDKYKTPIRMAMDAPLGMLEIKLVKIER